MKLNRKWMLVLALVLSVAMATGGTLAYLTDRDTEVNVFTMGNVDIELKEDFEQDSELIPGLDIEKEPTITNVGPNDAWVWATIAIPSALDNDDASANVVHFNMSKDSVAEGKWTWWKKDSRTEWLKQYNVEYDGVNYNVFTVLYQTALKKGDTTEPVIYKVYMDPHVDIAPDGQLHHVENGKVTKLDWNINTNGNPKIYVSAYAMQTNEFADVYAAYEAYTAQWSTSGEAKDVIAWGEDDGETDTGRGDDEDVTYTVPADAIRVTNSAGLKAALDSKASTILLADGEYNWSGTGHNGTAQTVSIYGESKDAILYHTNEGEGAADYDFDGYTVNFYGLTISGENNQISYPGWARMAATYNDCVIKQTYGLYAGTHTFNYCTLNVTGDQYNLWTWGAENATFNNCTFNSDGKAVLLYGTANTKLTLNNCVFNDTGVLPDLKAAVEIGNDYNKSYELIVNNTKVNGYEVNDKGINTGSTLWGNKNSMSSDKLNVVIDGVDIY